MNPSTNARIARIKGRRTRYGTLLRRLVGSAILLSGTVIFAVDIAASAAVSMAPPGIAAR